MEKEIYIVDFAWYPNFKLEIWKAVIVTKTDKMIIIKNQENVFGAGYYLPNRLLKSKYHFFDTEYDANDFAIEKYFSEIIGLESKIDLYKNKIFLEPYLRRVTIDILFNAIEYIESKTTGVKCER